MPVYDPTVWQNKPSTATPINATRLNKLEQGVVDAYNRANHTGTQLASTISDLPEVIQDTVFAALAGVGITFSYNDAAGTITGSVDAEFIRDTLAPVLVEGTGITITVSDVANTITIAATGGGGGGGSIPVSKEFFLTGALSVVTGDYELYNDTGLTLTIVSVRATVGIAPLGHVVKVDLNNEGTTVFTNQTHRPTIAIGANTNRVTTIDVPTWLDGEALTVDIDETGTDPNFGGNLVVTVVAMTP